ncbi:MAG: sulfatase [Verrucomicrobiales bacterium]|nr:sulfatase [Verrucomicrobiales bacterium]
MKHLSLLLSLMALTGALQAQEKLNFVFFLADDLGYHDVGFNNPNSFYETPNLDQLAASGMVFTDFYAASQVCSPTRASIFTGKYPARTDTTNFFTGRRNGKFAAADFENVMAAEEVTLAEALKENGYQTFFGGKWHLGDGENLPTNQGFDINKGGGANGLPRSYFSPYKNVENLPAGPEGEFLTDRLAQESVDFLNSAAKSDDPFLLYLSFYSVHTPLQAPKNLIAKYEAKAKKLGIDGEEGSFDLEKERQVWPDTDEPRKLRVRQDHAVYAAMVESLDTAVGEVLGRLDQLNLRDKTAIIFMSDNGGLSTSEGHPTSNLPLRGGKGWMYEGGIREPVAIRWPGVTAAGTRCTVPAVSTDFYPTILEMAGLPAKPDQHVDGRSLVPVLRNPFAKFDRGPIFFHYPHYANQGGFPASAIRKGDYKLIQDLEDGAFELYNLSTDIEEHNNLEQLESSVVEELSVELNEWRREVDAKPLRKHPETGAEPPALW